MMLLTSSPRKGSKFCGKRRTSGWAERLVLVMWDAESALVGVPGVRVAPVVRGMHPYRT
jgi:hypothetical protein